MAQLALPLRPEASYDEADFIPGEGSREALALALSFPPPGLYAVIAGPQGSGKTHLSHIWSGRVKAGRADITQLGLRPSAELFGDAPALALEDIHALANETALFHLLRFAETEQKPLLLTSRLPAAQLPFTLPDLASRLRSCAQAVIAPPDDEALRAYLLKQFADRQWRVPPEAASYLLVQGERSFAGLGRLCDRIALRQEETKRHITIPFIKSVVELLE